MIIVSVYKQSSSFAVSVKKIREVITRELQAKVGMVSDSEVLVAIVGQKYMDKLIRQYYKEDSKEEYEHPILTFPAAELSRAFQFPPDGITHLGEIVISYPSTKGIAIEKNKLLDEVIEELVVHGVLHLVGIHHE